MIAAPQPPAEHVSAGGAVAFLIIILLIAYLFGASRHGWTLDTWRMSGHDMSGHDMSSSEGVDMSDEDDPEDVSTPDVRPVRGDLDRDGWAVEPDPDALRVRVPPRPAPELAADPEPRKATSAERQAWLRARMAPGDQVARGKTLKQLDVIAADLFGVEDRTIRRDRKAISRAAGR